MNKFVGKFKGFPIYVSDRQEKKYYALVDGKKVHFGDKRYQHYKDKMGYYSDLNHLDVKRRRLYKIRHQKNRNKYASAGWFADKILW